MARRAPIRVTAIERELGTRYTIDTLRALERRYPRRRFVWLMGADNLAQFHRWKDWRAIARAMPIAVIARPGYDGAALASPAMAWLRRYRLPASGLKNRQEWSAPALIALRFDPDPRSATELRQADPDWAERFSGPPPRDAVTHLPISDQHGTAAA
jgi:nicotinate-nucleotide adenylyltransferase